MGAFFAILAYYKDALLRDLNDTKKFSHLHDTERQALRKSLESKEGLLLVFLVQNKINAIEKARINEDESIVESILQAKTKGEVARLANSIKEIAPVAEASHKKKHSVSE